MYCCTALRGRIMRCQSHCQWVARRIGYVFHIGTGGCLIASGRLPGAAGATEKIIEIIT